MQKSGFLEMRHYVGFLQIGSHIMAFSFDLRYECVTYTVKSIKILLQQLFPYTLKHNA